MKRLLLSLLLLAIFVSCEVIGEDPLPERKEKYALIMTDTGSDMGQIEIINSGVFFTMQQSTDIARGSKNLPNTRHLDGIIFGEEPDTMEFRGILNQEGTSSIILVIKSTAEGNHTFELTASRK